MELVGDADKLAPDCGDQRSLELIISCSLGIPKAFERNLLLPIAMLCDQRQECMALILAHECHSGK